MCDMMAGSCLGHNSHKMIEFSILKEARKKMLQPTPEGEGLTEVLVHRSF